MGALELGFCGTELGMSCRSDLERRRVLLNEKEGSRVPHSRSRGVLLYHPVQSAHTALESCPNILHNLQMCFESENH